MELVMKAQGGLEERLIAIDTDELKKIERAVRRLDEMVDEFDGSHELFVHALKCMSIRTRPWLHEISMISDELAVVGINIFQPNAILM